MRLVARGPNAADRRGPCGDVGDEWDRFEHHRVGYDQRPMVFRGDGTFVAGGVGCELEWTIQDGRLLIAANDTHGQKRRRRRVADRLPGGRVAGVVSSNLPDRGQATALTARHVGGERGAEPSTPTLTGPCAIGSRPPRRKLEPECHQHEDSIGCRRHGSRITTTTPQELPPGCQSQARRSPQTYTRNAPVADCLGVSDRGTVMDLGQTAVFS
jgi:hypothetical protein